MTARMMLAALAAMLSWCGPAHSVGKIDEGTTETKWYTGTPSKPDVTPGTWRVGGPNPSQAGFKLLKQSAHFVFYSDEAVSPADLNLAADTLENTVWHNLF